MGITKRDSKLIERILQSPEEAKKVLDEVGYDEYLELFKIGNMLKTKRDKHKES